MVSGRASGKGCCDTPLCCERCRAWQAATDRRLELLEDSIQRSVSEQVDLGMEGLLSFLADQLAEIEARLEKTPKNERRSGSFSVSSLTGTDQPSRLSQQSLRRLSRELSSQTRGTPADPPGPSSDESDDAPSGSSAQTRSTASRKRVPRPTPGTEERSRRSKSSRRTTSELSAVAFEPVTRPAAALETFATAFETEDEGLGRSASRPLTINAVGAGTSPAYGSYYNTSTMAELRKKHPAPQFSGKVADWAKFEEDWESYAALYSIGLHPEVMIDLLKLCLPTGMQETIRLYRQQQPGITFSEVFERFRKDYRLDNPYDARARWWDHRLQLPKTGRLDLTSFLNWRMKHEALRNRVADFSPHEEYTIILRALPDYWKNKVADFEKKLRRDSHWCRLSGLRLEEQQVRDLLDPFLPDDGHRRRPEIAEVRVLSNSIEVETRRLAHHEALLKLSGLKVSTKQGSFPLQIVEAKFRLTPERIFSYLRDELRSQESDSALKSSVLQPGNAPRKVQEIQATKSKPKPGSDPVTDRPSGKLGSDGDHRGSPKDDQAVGATEVMQVGRSGNRPNKSKVPPSKKDGRKDQDSPKEQVRAVGGSGKTYPKPNPDLPFIPPPTYTGGCWWCHRRGLDDKHDYKTCKGRLEGRAGYEKIKLARARSQSRGPQGGY